MSITLTLNPDVEKSLVDRARERGLTLDAYLEEIVRRNVLISPAAQESGKDKAEAFVNWAKGDRPTKPLSDEAISRAALYPDRL